MCSSDLESDPRRQLRTDGTLVESNIRPPSDSRLLADSVERGRTLLKAAKQKVQEEFEDFRQKAKGIARKIGETLRSKQGSSTHGRQTAL